MTALTLANEKQWKDLPGENTIFKKYYLYNCTNLEDVIYFNQAPEFMEVGPFIY